MELHVQLASKNRRGSEELYSALKIAQLHRQSGTRGAAGNLLPTPCVIP